MKDPLNKTTCNCIRAIATICIILIHTNNEFFKGTGQLFTGIFFFYSGYGLYISVKNKTHYLNGFIQNRIIKIYLPFVLTNILIYSVLRFILDSLKDENFFTDVFGINSINPYGWYVWTIIFLYAIFYVIFKFIKNEKLSILLIFITTVIYISFCYYYHVGNWWYNSAICFVFGIIYGQNKEFVLEKIKKYYFILFTIFVLLFSSSFYFILYKEWEYNVLIEMLSALFFVSILIMFCCKFEIKDKLLNSIGKISYEVYLCQRIFIVLLLIIPNWKIYSVLCILCSILFGYVLHNICAGIYNKLINSKLFNKYT